MRQRKNSLILTYRQWINKYGNEECNGCMYNISNKAKCTYKKNECYRYEIYKKQFNEEIEQMEIFEENI